MFFGFSLLMGLSALAPVFAVADGMVVQQLVTLSASIGLVTVAAAARTADVKQVADITRWLWLAACAPAVWLIVQAIPLPGSIVNSIWTSASAALQDNLLGHISIDPGKTINTLLQYLTGVALVVVGIFVMRDRRRAELMLFALCASTTSTAIVLLLERSGYFGSIEAGVDETLAAVSMLGFVINLAAAVRVIERYDRGRGEATLSYRSAAISFAVWGAAAAVCLLALASIATLDIGIVAAFGIATFTSIQLIRRIGTSRWLIGVFCSTAAAAAIMIIAWRYDGARPLSAALRFATTTSSPETLDQVQRMIADANWTGSGGGTFAALLPIYGDAGHPIAMPPTTIAAIAIEWGWPAMVVTVILAIGLMIVLFAGALRRGRDSFYPAAAAACIVILVSEAFCDASLLRSAIAVMGEIVIALGLAQSVSRVG